MLTDTSVMTYTGLLTDVEWSTPVDKRMKFRRKQYSNVGSCVTMQESKLLREDGKVNFEMSNYHYSASRQESKFFDFTHLCL